MRLGKYPVIALAGRLLQHYHLLNPYDRMECPCMVGPTSGVIDRSLSERLRFARRVAGMTQAQLAMAIGVPVSQIRRYEAGTAVISAGTMLSIAVALDAPLAWMYGIDDADHWPQTALAALLQDPDMPALALAFRGIADPQTRRLVLNMARQLGHSPARPPPRDVPVERVPEAIFTETKRRVLLVDDAPDVLVVVGAFLQGGGYEVVRAHSAEAALTVLAGDETLDVLVTDHGMPGMSGLELLERAGTLRPGLPVVVITTQMADFSMTIRHREDVRVLAKPFARTDLLAAIAACCARAEARLPPDTSLSSER